MTAVLDEPAAEMQTTPAQRLRTTMGGVRLSVTSLGVRKTLTPQQKAQAADTFGAEGAYMSAAKKLLDTAHPAFKRVTGVKNQAVQFWRGLSLPYPESGLRLIRQDDIQGFNVQMATLKTALDEAVQQLNRHYADLVVGGLMRDHGDQLEFASAGRRGGGELCDSADGNGARRVRRKLSLVSSIPGRLSRLS